MVVIENESDDYRKQSSGMSLQPSSVDVGGSRKSPPNRKTYETIPLSPMPSATSEGKVGPPVPPRCDRFKRMKHDLYMMFAKTNGYLDLFYDDSCESDDDWNVQGLERESSTSRTPIAERRLGPSTLPRRTNQRPTGDNRDGEQTAVKVRLSIGTVNEDENQGQLTALGKIFDDIGSVPISIASLSVEEVS
jgi:hypothetical protein